MLEKLFYESKPYLCAYFAFYALTQPNKSIIMSISGLILLIVAVFLIYFRWSYRGYFK